MNWLEIDVIVPASLEEVAIGCLTSIGCSNLQVIRTEDLPEFDVVWPLPVTAAPAASASGASLTDPSGTVLLRSYLPAGSDPADDLERSLHAASVPAAKRTVNIRCIEDPGWSRSWRKYFKPMRVGKRLLILPSWSRRQIRPGELGIVLDPGMAFGTGHHATTRLCLQAIEKYLQIGNSVIDVGCGSGILSIAAAKLGAGSVLAIDLDPVAVAVTAENVSRNNEASVVETAVGTLEEAGRSADLVVANILAAVVTDLLPVMKSRLSVSGKAVLSGIASNQAEQVLRALSRERWTTVEETHLDQWCCIAAAPGDEPICA